MLHKLYPLLRFPWLQEILTKYAGCGKALNIHSVVYSFFIHSLIYQYPGHVQGPGTIPKTIGVWQHHKHIRLLIHNLGQYIKRQYVKYMNGVNTLSPLCLFSPVCR